MSYNEAVVSFLYCTGCPAINPSWHIEKIEFRNTGRFWDQHVCDTCHSPASWFTDAHVSYEWQHRDQPPLGAQRYATNDLTALVRLCLHLGKSLRSIRRTSGMGGSFEGMRTVYFIDVKAKHHQKAIDKLEGVFLEASGT